MMKFGDIIRQERLLLGYTQKEVARMIGLRSNSSVSQYELNKHKPSLSILKKICELYALDFKEMSKLVYGQEVEYNFANIIKMRRQELKMSAAEVAEKIGITEACLSDYECREIAVPARTLRKICKFYKLNEEEILDMFYTIDYTNIATLFKSVRKRLGLHRCEISCKFKYNPGYLSSIENGFRKPDYRRLYELCNLYNLDFDWVCRNYYGDDITSLGYKLKIVRIMKNIQQIEVAEILGLSNRMISSIETNRYKPNYKLIRQLCKIYDLDLNEIYYTYYGIRLKDSLGLRLRNMRLDKDLTTREAGELVGLSNVTICNYEANKSRPSEEILNKLYEVYKIEE